MGRGFGISGESAARAKLRRADGAEGAQSCSLYDYVLPYLCLVSSNDSFDWDDPELLPRQLSAFASASLSLESRSPGSLVRAPFSRSTAAQLIQYAQSALFSGFTYLLLDHGFSR